MPAMDFPSSPTNGQVYGNYTYDSAKGAWRVTGIAATSVISSATPPLSPISGTLWLNTNDGVLFVYYTDADTSQWVEVKSNTASGSTVAARVDALELADTTTNKSGLVPITPTSITVDQGSASGIGNTVTFTNVRFLGLNGIFSSAYQSYRILLSGTASGQYDFYAGMSVNGTLFTGLNHYFAGSRMYTTSMNYEGGSGDSQIRIGQHSAGLWDNAVEIIRPYETTRTNLSSVGWGYGGADAAYTMFGTVNQTTQYDGMKFFQGGGTFSGTAKIYGYR